MAYTIQRFENSQQTDMLSAMKAELESTGLFDSVTVTGLVLNAYINGTLRFTIDNTNWISYTAYLSDGTTAAFTLNIQSYSITFVAATEHGVLLKHNTASGGVLVGKTESGEAFFSCCSASDAYSTVSESSGNAWTASIGINSSDTWSTLASLSAYGSGADIPTADSAYRFVDRQINISVTSVYLATIGGATYLTDGYFCLKE